MLDDRYLQPTYAARYLEAEWGDLLLRHGRFPDGLGAPLGFQAESVRFYGRVVAMIQHHAAQTPGFMPQRIADFGCATGRLVRELCHAFPAAQEVHGFEPSSLLCSLAHQMVGGVPLPARLPYVDSPCGDLGELEVSDDLQAALQPTPATARARFSVGRAEDDAVAPDHYDLVTCLNVLDRHPAPDRLVQAVSASLRRGGLLCLSSPLEWQESSTPRALWRDSVVEFLAPAHYHVIAAEDMDYHFRLNSRRRIHYITEVVVARRCD